MEHGQLGLQSTSTTVVVFEELIAHLSRRRSEKIAVRIQQWDLALGCWTFDYRVLDFLARFMFVHEMPIRVVTWRPPGFAEALHDYLWKMECPVNETVATDYRRISPLYATDAQIIAVYDADPDHRFGYGFKCRDYTGVV